MKIWSDFETFFDYGHYFDTDKGKEITIKYEPVDYSIPRYKDKVFDEEAHKLGWRDAVRAYSDVIMGIIGKYEVMSKENEYEAFMYKFGEEYGIHRYKKDKWFFNINDVFSPAADAEEITPEDFPEVKKIVEYWGYNGLLYWAWKKQGKPKSFKKHINKLMERMEFLQIQDEGLI